MENKYYTPEIEEFHIGFEFEYENKLLKQWKQEKLSLATPNWDWDWGIISSIVERGAIRVKYLDKEDIESLGFNYVCDDRDGKNIIVYNKAINEEIWVLCDYRYRFDEDVEEAKLPIRIFKSNPKYHDNTFLGVIKNKSELKRVLKMLNIINLQK